MSKDKEPARLQGIDAIAHRAFRSFRVLRGAVSSAQLGELITLHPTDPHCPRLFAKAAERLRGVLPTDLVPDIEHIGRTAVPRLDAKPIVDLMVGLREPERIREIVTLLEGLATKVSVRRVYRAAGPYAHETAGQLTTFRELRMMGSVGG